MIHKTYMLRVIKGSPGNLGVNSGEALAILSSRRAGMKGSLKPVTERKALCKELWLIDRSSV